ncbi:MAG: carboxylesterase family protein [Actinobacteria bacterium]|nr:carboxylesterase family protein [Actinomycetota bacterium]
MRILKLSTIFAATMVFLVAVPGQSGAEPSEPNAPVANDSDFPNITYKRFYLSAEQPEYPIKLDVYKPDGTPPPGGFPGVIVIHGGAWKDGDKLSDNAAFVAEYLETQGLVAFSINYRLTCEPPPAPRSA